MTGYKYSMHRPPGSGRKKKKGTIEARENVKSWDSDITLPWKRKPAVEGAWSEESKRRWEEEAQMGGCTVYTGKKYPGL